MILYCAISHKELEELFDSGMRFFPVRDRVFYFEGKSHLLRSELINSNKTQYLVRFSLHQEYSQLLPNERGEFITINKNRIDELNNHVFGSIEIPEGHFHNNYSGTISTSKYFSRCSNATEILTLLMKTYLYNGVDFYFAIKTNLKLIFCNFAYWKSLPESNIAEGCTIHSILDKTAQIIDESYPSITLPTCTKILDSELEE